MQPGCHRVTSYTSADAVPGTPWGLTPVSRLRNASLRHMSSSGREPTHLLACVSESLSAVFRCNHSVQLLKTCFGFHLGLRVFDIGPDERRLSAPDDSFSHDLFDLGDQRFLPRTEERIEVISAQ